MKKVEVRLATRDDLIARYGSCDYTLLAYVGVVDGEVIGLGGVAFVQGRAIAFFDITDELRQMPVFLTKTALTVLRRARQLGHRHIFCGPEPGEPRARPWLERIGFKDIGNGVLEWQPSRS